VSRVESATDTATTDCAAAEIIEQIRSDEKLRERITRIRDNYWRIMDSTNGDRKAAKTAVAAQKKALQAVTWSGTFKRRRKDALLQHSGLLCADLDELGGEKLVEVSVALRESIHLWSLFISPTGDGLKAIFRVAADPETHEVSFRAVEEHVRTLTGIQIDQSGSDVSRLCFFSHDPVAYLNEQAVELVVSAKQAVAENSAPPRPINGDQLQNRRGLA